MTRTVTTTTTTEQSSTVYGGYDLNFTVNRKDDKITSIEVKGNKTTGVNNSGMNGISFSFVPTFSVLDDYNKDILIGIVEELLQIINHEEV